eukprot:GHVP01057643.1.p1 GENE.GHVP01057643.1~~GHVP01057643.1.p1  ORF type:complete len:215 (+),score=27.91 GHVP01057643.1:52-696(+)
MIFQNELSKLTHDAVTTEFIIPNVGVAGEDYEITDSFSTTELSFKMRRAYCQSRDDTVSEYETGQYEYCSPAEEAKLKEKKEAEEERDYLKDNGKLRDKYFVNTSRFSPELKTKLCEYLRGFLSDEEYARIWNTTQREATISLHEHRSGYVQISLQGCEIRRRLGEDFNVVVEELVKIVRDVKEKLGLEYFTRYCRKWGESQQRKDGRDYTIHW